MTFFPAVPLPHLPVFSKDHGFVLTQSKENWPLVSVACYSLGVGAVHTGKRWTEMQLLFRTAGERKFRGTLACSSSSVHLPVEHIACTAHVGGCRCQANIFHDLSQHCSPQRPPG